MCNTLLGSRRAFSTMPCLGSTAVLCGWVSQPNTKFVWLLLSCFQLHMAGNSFLASTSFTRRTRCLRGCGDSSIDRKILALLPYRFYHILFNSSPSHTRFVRNVRDVSAVFLAFIRLYRDVSLCASLPAPTLGCCDDDARSGDAVAPMQSVIGRFARGVAIALVHIYILSFLS